MSNFIEPCGLRSPVHLEIDSLLLRQAENLGVNIVSLFEQSLRSELTSPEPAPRSLLNNIEVVYRNLIGEHPACALGLRQYFREK